MARSYCIDVNPSIVEPMNTLYSVVDLMDALLTVSASDTDAISEALPSGRMGVETHQLFLAILKVGMNGRTTVLREVFWTILSQESYEGSVEELTPFRGDIISFILVCGVVLMVIIGGSTIAANTERERSQQLCSKSKRLVSDTQENGEEQ
jgi:hypothetical protein